VRASKLMLRGCAMSLGVCDVYAQSGPPSIPTHTGFLAQDTQLLQLVFNPPAAKPAAK
jgi:hypothetical protein